VSVLLCSRYYIKEADTALEKGCDTECLKKNLCEIVTAQMGELTQCNILLKKFQTAGENSFNLLRS
jgi:hypothetical protein